MRIVVDRDRCTGHAICESLAADLFKLNDDGQAEIRAAVVPDGRAGYARQAAACCPNQALRLVP